MEKNQDGFVGRMCRMSAMYCPVSFREPDYWNEEWH